MKYQFHSQGHFKLSGKPGITTYFLSGRNSISRSFIPQQQQQQQHPYDNANSFRLPNPTSAPKQSESSYEFTSSSSAVSSGRECQQPPSMELPIHKPPPALPLKDNAVQVGRVYMTPPSSLGRRRSILDDPAINGQRKIGNRPPLGVFHIPSAPVAPAVAEEDRSPDLPTVHYRNVIGPTGGVGVTGPCSEKNTLTQSQILNNPPNGLALHRQISDLSTRSQITPSLANASVVQKRNSGRSSASDSCPGSRKQSLGEINKHVDLHAVAMTASPSKGSSGSSSQGAPSSRASSASSRPNNQRGQAAVVPVNGGFENNPPVEGRRLSKMEMDDIDKIMKEFTVDSEKKNGDVAIFKPMNHYPQQNQLLQQQHQQQQIQLQQQQLQQQQQMQQQHQHMQHRLRHQLQQQLLVQQLFQPPANNICGRPSSLLGMQSTPTQKLNLMNLQNGQRLLPDDVLQPPVTAIVAAQVKCAPRISLAHQMYATPEPTTWMTTEKLVVPQKALLVGSSNTNNSKDGLVRGFSPPPLPPPLPATQVPMFTRAKHPASINTNAKAAPPFFIPRLLNNGCLQLPQPASRPVSLYFAVGGGGGPRPASTAQGFRPLGPSYSKKIYASKGGHAPQSSSNHPRRPQGVGPVPLRHARSLENITSDADDRRSNSPRSGSPLRPDGLYVRSARGQCLVPLDNLSLSSYSGSEVSRSDPTFGYDSGSAVESEYDNYRPGMGSDEDYFVLEPISDIDLDMFDDINVDNVEVSENYNCSYIPMLQKLITDV